MAWKYVAPVAIVAAFAIGSSAILFAPKVNSVSAAQQTQYACPAGTVVGSQLANTGQQCVSIPAGPQGVPGPSAYDLAISTGYSGSLSAWLQSLVGATGPQGIQGAQGIAGQVGSSGPAGIAGVVGVAGQAATITVGTATQTLAYGATPTVTNSGTSSAAVLNFNYPSFTAPSYISPAVTTASLLAYGTQTVSMAAAVTTSQGFQCGVIGGGNTTPKLSATATALTNGTLTFYVTNESTLALSGTPVVTAVCKPLN